MNETVAGRFLELHLLHMNSTLLVLGNLPSHDALDMQAILADLGDYRLTHAHIHTHTPYCTTHTKHTLVSFGYVYRIPMFYTTNKTLVTTKTIRTHTHTHTPA